MSLSLKPGPVRMADGSYLYKGVRIWRPEHPPLKSWSWHIGPRIDRRNFRTLRDAVQSVDSAGSK